MKLWVIVSLFLTTIFSAYSQRFKCGCNELVKENYASSQNFFERISKNEFLKNAGLARFFFTKGEYEKAYEGANLALNLWGKQSGFAKKKAELCQVDSIRLEEIKCLSANLEFEKLLNWPTAEGWTHYIEKYNLSSNIERATYYRDSLIISHIIQTRKSENVKEFIELYPNSFFIPKAKELFCEFQYNEFVPFENLEYLELFAKEHVDNCKIEQVQFSIFSIYEKTQRIPELQRYIENYPNQPWVQQAWQAIYKLYTEEWNYNKIDDFRREFPNYPFADELIRDIALLNEDLFPFEKDGFFGFINERGEVRIPPSYEDVSFFKNDIAVVQQAGKFGAINKRNQMVVSCLYNTLYDFDQDVTIVGDSLYFGLISKSGEVIVPMSYIEIKRISPLVFIFQDTLGYRFHNSKGAILKRDIYQEITPLSNGNLRCKLNSKIGVLNSKLTEIVPIQFDDVELVSDSLFIVKQSDKYGIYDAKKGIIVNPIYERLKVLDASKGLMLVKKAKELQICKFNGSKHIALSFEYSPKLFEIISFHQNVTTFSQKGKFGSMDINGKIQLKPQFDEMGSTNILTPFKSNNQWGFLSQNLVQVSPRYDAFYTLNKLGFIVEKNGKQGVIDFTGKEIISVQYNSVKWVKEGYYILDANGFLGLADQFGTIIAPCDNKTIQVKGSDLFLLQNSNETRYFIPSKSLWIIAHE